MRIISGKFRGKKIIAPRKLPVRPTTDMAKEALFNILGNNYALNSIRVLDLFSGTGNVSYEFASRGCQSITAVDSHAGCVRFIRKTTADLGLPIQVIKASAYSYINSDIHGSFDVIFADPHYDTTLDDFKRIIIRVFENGLLRPGGTLILEHSKHTDLTGEQYLTDQRKYGGNQFSFFNPEIASE
jgi:16S rRNA (guanine(966)-N(2))-methyltransferase RsmD